MVGTCGSAGARVLPPVAIGRILPSLSTGMIAGSEDLDGSFKDIVELLSSIGFSSPPAWLRPFPVLSTGQQFRALLARLLAEAAGELVVCDEFTSVVDRTVAQVGSAALARTVRQRGQQFIARIERKARSRSKATSGS